MANVTDSTDRTTTQPDPRDVLISPQFQEASRQWWQEALGDRIPPDWPILPVYVQEYIETVLQPALTARSEEGA